MIMLFYLFLAFSFGVTLSHKLTDKWWQEETIRKRCATWIIIDYITGKTKFVWKEDWRIAEMWETGNFSNNELSHLHEVLKKLDLEWMCKDIIYEEKVKLVKELKAAPDMLKVLKEKFPKCFQD